MFQRSIGVLALTLTVSLLNGKFLRADEGAWLFNRPPHALLKERYGVELSPEWLEHVQKACVRFGRGGSASFVSADGLVLTNHHVGDGQISRLSSAERDLIKNGFVARTREQELRCEGHTVYSLWEIEDVTQQIESALPASATSADAAAARQKTIARIEAESLEKTGLHSEVVTLYRGALHHLYRYKIFDDIRLAWAPEKQAASFGGDADNFDYPRYALDAALFRVYENGKPYHPPHHLAWARRGAREGDVIFVTGHPYRTQQLLTVAHLRFLRDDYYPNVLAALWRRESQLLQFCDRSLENARIGQDHLGGAQNSRKAFTGYLDGLLDPRTFAAKQSAETALRDAVAANPEYAARWGDAWDRLEHALRAYRDFRERHMLMDGRAAALDGRLYGYARDLLRLATESAKPNEERLPEYRDGAVDSLRRRLLAPSPVYPQLETTLLANGLTRLVEVLGGEDPLVVAALDGQSPRARAAALVAGTTLADPQRRQALIEGGLEALNASDDPLLRFASIIAPEALKLRKRYETEFEAVEQEAYAKIAAASFAINGETQAPDATGSLRLSFGKIEGIPGEDGDIPAFTTLNGLFERSAARRGLPPFEVPEQWAPRRDQLDLRTPFNFITTAQVIGGNSGSPVVNKTGEVVGLIFDINVPALSWDTLYGEPTARSVAVDVRAIIEALVQIYDAGPLALELAGGP